MQQAISVLPAVLHTFPEFTHDFSSLSGNFDANFSLATFCRDLSFTLKIDDTDQKFDQQKNQHDFTFPSADPPQGSLLAVDQIFHNGRIRTTSPQYHQSMLFSAADADAGQESPLLPPPTKRRRETTTLGQKCNSTGFSKLYRYRRDVKHRRNSEGTDAFVFLKRPPAPEKLEKKKEVKNEVVKCGKRKTAPSCWAHEELYLMNRKRTESNKRRSFLPYKKQIFGLFSNMN